VIYSHNALRGTQEEWETMGLEKRIDFDNLKRVFERLDLKHDGRIDMEELADIYKVVNHVKYLPLCFGLFGCYVCERWQENLCMQ